MVIPMCSNCSMNTAGQHEWNCPLNSNNLSHAPKSKEYKMICITCNKNFLPEGVFAGKN